MIDDVAQEKIMEAYEKSVLQEAVKDLSEAGSDVPLGTIADIFARYLVGDRAAAVNQLKKHSKQKIEKFDQLLFDYVGGGSDMKDPGAYNKLYANLQKAITNALRQAK